MDRYLVAALVGLMCALPLEAQETGTLVGRVVESTTQRPLVGAAVSIDGTQMGTLTRADGGFLLAGVPAGTHTVSANLIGYGSQQQQVTVRSGESTNVRFELQPQAVVLQEVVATGYSTQRREAITGSVATLQADEANVGNISNANELMQGRIAGLQVTLNNGEPGAGAQVRIRGGTSISASNEPLYVIDGVPIDNRPTEATGLGINSDPPLARSPLNLINPNDIESITVLKDAAAAAIYGSRAANGVVLIQTKGGAGAAGSGVEYEGYIASASPASKLDLMTGADYRNFVQSLVNQGETRFADRLANLGNANTDWEDELTQTAITHNHNLTFYGGNENTQYRASLNYMNQEGVVINNGFERIQGRLKASHDALGDRLRLGANVNVSHMINDYLPYENTGGFEGAVFTNMVIYDPTRPVMVTDPAGQPDFYEHGPGRQEQRNPVALATEVADDGTTTRILGNTTASLELLDGLTAEVNLGLDRSEGQRLNYLPRNSPVGAEFGGRARQVSRDNTALTLQTYLKAVRSYGVHDVDFVGGYEYADYYTSEFGAEGRDFATDAFGYNSLGGGNVTIPPFSWVEDSRLVSFFGRANYGYANKYFLTGVLRREGSSRFGSGNKWAVFPAVSASWRLSEESFMVGSMFSDLRLRAGWGKQGNQAVPPYASLITLGPGGNYSFGDNAVTGIQPTRNANPNLKWEETSQVNVAVDYALFQDRLAGTIEFYRKSTDDLLLEVPVPQPALVPTRLENVGQTESQGVELSLDALLMSRENLSWRSGLVFSADRNEVVSLGGDRKFLQSARASGQGQSDTWTQRLIPGEPMGTFFGPEYIGVDASGKQLFRCTDKNPTCANGQTTSPSGDDYVVLGNANPDFTLGWRNQVNVGSFDVSSFIRAEVGQEVFNNTALVYATKGAVLQGRNFLRSALDDGVGIDEPAIYSSRWIESGSFLRVQNVTIGYTFDASRLMAQARSARAYVSFDNLLLMTDYSGYDPEVHTAAEGLAVRGVDYLNYPRPRTVTTGIRLTF